MTTIFKSGVKTLELSKEGSTVTIKIIGSYSQQEFAFLDVIAAQDFIDNLQKLIKE